MLRFHRYRQTAWSQWPRRRCVAGPAANLFGEPAVFSGCFKGTQPHRSFVRQFDEKNRRVDNSRPPDIPSREDFEALLEKQCARKILTRVEADRVRLLVDHPTEGITALASREHVSPAAMSICIANICRKWPPCGWLLNAKRSLIQRRQLQCQSSNESLSEF
jgi:hypothetical protein